MYIHDEETHCFFKHLKQTSGQIPADKKLIIWIGSWGALLTRVVTALGVFQETT